MDEGSIYFSTVYGSAIYKNYRIHQQKNEWILDSILEEEKPKDIISRNIYSTQEKCRIDTINKIILEKPDGLLLYPCNKAPIYVQKRSEFFAVLQREFSEFF